MALKLKDVFACSLTLILALNVSIPRAFAGGPPPEYTSKLPAKVREAAEARVCDPKRPRQNNQITPCGDGSRVPTDKSGSGAQDTSGSAGQPHASLIGLSNEARAQPVFGQVPSSPVSKGNSASVGVDSGPLRNELLAGAPRGSIEAQAICDPGALTQQLRDTAQCPCNSPFNQRISWLRLPSDGVGYSSWNSGGTPFSYHDAYAMDLAVQTCSNILLTGYGEGYDEGMLDDARNAYVARLTSPTSVSVNFLPSQLSNPDWWNYQSRGMSVRVNTSLGNRVEVAGHYREPYTDNYNGFVWRDPLSAGGGQFSLADFDAEHPAAFANDSLILSGSATTGSAAVSASLGKGHLAYEMGAQWSPSGTVSLRTPFPPGSLSIWGEGSAFEGTRLALTLGSAGRLFASATHRLNPTSGATSRAARLTLTAQAGEPVEVRMSDIAGRPVASAYSISVDGRLVVGQASASWSDGDQAVRSGARAFVWDATPTGIGIPPPSLPPSPINPPTGADRLTAWAIATEDPTLAYVVGSFKSGFDESTRRAYVAVCNRSSTSTGFTCGTPRDLKNLLQDGYGINMATSILTSADAVIFKSGLLWIAGYGYETDMTTEGFKPFVIAIVP